ncbi:maltose alpha-glucosidase Agl1 [Schizosaccharomyces osmophilus]|uniref:Maltose alpha-glucosidase Agl1 n=1 Tax=Schizosaccharomyces osmophilus TaxID=2545709 RepID=A0AAE9W8L6_9SCHI|nr:maltose alpha-glucosidase Agl1 [Schizosaccharomyces osmophilus]WBW71383.1 maltose alpha-glucosidase Agl1 [Schizosaccharomyces osmophilus]
MQLPLKFFFGSIFFFYLSSLPFVSLADDSASSTSFSYRVEPTPIPPQQGIPQRLSVYEAYRGGDCHGYRAKEISSTEQGVIGSLELIGSPCYAYGTDYKKLFLNVTYETEERIHVSIRDINSTQFQFSSRHDVWDAPLYHPSSVNQFNVHYNFSFNADPFEFWITRKSDGEVLFDTRGHPLIFEDQYIELTTNMVEDYNIYGLAETIHGLRLGNNLTRTFWANDEASPLDQNMYGTHPFYLEQRYNPVNDSSTQQQKHTSSSHGVLMLTANGMDVVLRPKYLQYRMIGGIIDLYVYSGSKKPQNTITQFIESVGFPQMQQYWTLGFHMCRWGYENIDEIIQVRENMRKFDIPIETFWSDIDYMHNMRDFTVDPISYPREQMIDFFHDIELAHQHFVPIVDAAVYAANPSNRSDDSYGPYYEGIEKDVFLKNPDGSLYIGEVWPGFTVFPDFTNPSVQDYWKHGIHNMSYALGSNSSDYIPFSGLWLDMNEPSSYCVGSCGSELVNMNPVHAPFKLPGEPNDLTLNYPEGFNLTNETEYASASSASLSQYYATATSSMQVVYPTAVSEGQQPKYDINHPPYAINTEQGNHDLANHGVSPNATHHDGTLRYNLFNVYGYGEIKVTHKALTDLQPEVRPFILSRSTFLGSGVYSAHWLGDNHSNWPNMFFSISGMMVFNMLGVPMVGADVCGFQDNSDEELCARWMAMGAFSPFYRNHNQQGSIRQEPYLWASVAESSRRAMNIRYSLLPYWYTLFRQASYDGSTLIRPLFFEFPDEPSLAGADRQFMVGDSLLITPVLEPNTTTVNGVFPGDEDTVWYDWYNHTAIEHKPYENKTMDAPLEHINVAVRGSKIIPMQQPAYTTEETRENPFNLLVALDKQGTAYGNVYADDGVSLTPNATLWVDFSAESNKLSSASFGTYNVHVPLANVTILGVSSSPKQIQFNNNSVNSFTYSDRTQELVVTNLDKFTSAGAFASNWTITW